MAFRADEARSSGEERARRYLVSRSIEPDQRAASETAFLDIIEEQGPVIDSYPTWHPLVATYPDRDRQRPSTTPDRKCGYTGLDHTVYFANGFVTCPYGDGQEVIDAVHKLPPQSIATITAERLDAQLYHPRTTAVLVRCEWGKPLPMDGMIPKSRAVPLLLEQELPCWWWAEVGETWETMLPSFLGRPHGRRSSLFVNQETGQAMKYVWNALIDTGMFGPIMVDSAG